MDEEVELVKSNVFSRIPASIKNKYECHTLLNSGLFGNKVDTASSYEEILEKEWKGTVSIRSRGKRIDRNLVLYNVPIEKIPTELEKLKILGIDIDKISFSSTPPDDKLKFQGEIMNSAQGLHLLYSTVKKPMNLALKDEEKIISGLSAINFLKENFSCASMEDLRELLRIFPNDVIEFSCYSIELGNIDNRNVIVWEVRGY